MSIAELTRTTDEAVVDDTETEIPDNPVADERGVAPKAAARRISLSVRTLGVGALVTALVLAVATLAWLYVGQKQKLDNQIQQAHDTEHAEQVALDYAVRAAIMDHKDLGQWKRSLVDGTTPELSKKLTDAANAMEQILLPLQWSSTAKPIAAKVRLHDKGVYVVDSFVSVMTKTVQAADKLQSTATYAVTIDPSNGWKITDVGGIGQVVGDK